MANNEVEDGRLVRITTGKNCSDCVWYKAWGLSIKGYCLREDGLPPTMQWNDCCAYWMGQSELKEMTGVLQARLKAAFEEINELHTAARAPNRVIADYEPAVAEADPGPRTIHVTEEDIANLGAGEMGRRVVAALQDRPDD